MGQRDPLASNENEIDRMAEALPSRADTTLEIDEKNLREVAQARRRLIDAIESISEGFALYDADDRLVLCNPRFREILHLGDADAVVPGMRFETIVRRCAGADRRSSSTVPADGSRSANIRSRAAARLGCTLTSPNSSTSRSGCRKVSHAMIWRCAVRTRACGIGMRAPTNSTFRPASESFQGLTRSRCGPPRANGSATCIRTTLRLIAA